MTRINLVDPANLANQHLMAEYREIFHIPKALERSLKSRTRDELDKILPQTYTLNKGHVMCFYNKGAFLEKRSKAIYKELLNRGYNVTEKIYPVEIFQKNSYYKDWEPTAEEISINVERICERLEKRPGWYKYYDLPIA